MFNAMFWASFWWMLRLDANLRTAQRTQLHLVPGGLWLLLFLTRSHERRRWADDHRRNFFELSPVAMVLSDSVMLTATENVSASESFGDTGEGRNEASAHICAAVSTSRCGSSAKKKRLTLEMYGKKPVGEMLHLPQWTYMDFPIWQTQWKLYFVEKLELFSPLPPPSAWNWTALVGSAHPRSSHPCDVDASRPIVETKKEGHLKRPEKKKNRKGTHEKITVIEPLKSNKIDSNW